MEPTVLLPALKDSKWLQLMSQMCHCVRQGRTGDPIQYLQVKHPSDWKCKSQYDWKTAQGGSLISDCHSANCKGLINPFLHPYATSTIINCELPFQPSRDQWPWDIPFRRHSDDFEKSEQIAHPHKTSLKCHLLHNKRGVRNWRGEKSEKSKICTKFCPWNYSKKGGNQNLLNLPMC